LVAAFALKAALDGDVGNARLLSDGNDNASSLTREKAIEMAQRAEVSVYTISTNPTARVHGNKNLERIAEATGGRSYVPFQITAVANAFTAREQCQRSRLGHED
jgi:Ca-activated chloride channel family protein